MAYGLVKLTQLYFIVAIFLSVWSTMKKMNVVRHLIPIYGVRVVVIHELLVGNSLFGRTDVYIYIYIIRDVRHYILIIMFDLRCY